MEWRQIFGRTSWITGLISLALALWGGTHLQHLLDDGGGRHPSVIVGGLIANSLALLADAGHMVTDAAAIGLALLAMWVAARPMSVQRTFGFHRTEILAALLNALSLWLVAGWIFLEAYRRFLAPSEVQGSLMLGVGAVGLLVRAQAKPVDRFCVNQQLYAGGDCRRVNRQQLGLARRCGTHGH